MVRLTFFFLMICCVCYSQETTVEGVIYEENTNSHVPFAKIFFQNTDVETLSNEFGRFRLTIPADKLESDSIIVSLLGYQNEKIRIEKGQRNNLTIHLNSTIFLKIDSKDDTANNQALLHIQKVIENKKLNNPSNYDFYSSKEYSKIRFDLNGFNEKINRNFLLKPLDYIWENTQTTKDGMNYLPVLLTERILQHYYRKSPKNSQDIVIGIKSNALSAINLTRFTEDLYFTPNIYENYITILDKSIPSPISDNAENSYQYYLMDSVITNKTKTYQIVYRPKQQNELAFSGEIFIDSASYAVSEISLRFSTDANINFVSNYFITNHYEKVGDSSRWMLTKTEVLGDFSAIEGADEMTGFFGRKKSIFSDFTVNDSIPTEKFDGVDLIAAGENKELMDDANWNTLRPDSLAEEEIALLKITERVKNDSKFKARAAILAILATGYVPTENLQIGNIFTFYTYNPVEYSRYKIGFRSNPRSAFPLSYSAYGAYGSRDEKWKYGGELVLNLTPNRKPTRIGTNYSYDIVQVGRSFNQIQLDHFFSSVNQGIFGATRNYIADFNAYFEKEIVTGLIARAGIYHQKYSATQFHSYTELSASGVRDTISNYAFSGLNFTFKFSHFYDKINGEFYDKKNLYALFRKYPDVALNINYSDNAILPTDANYLKTKLSVRQKVRANKWGYFLYNVEVGKTFGTVPFFLLDTPFGNELILNDVYSFNLMNFMEYAADQFATIHLEHHFDGLILDRVPLINKLKWRSFAFGKSYLGSLSDANKNSQYELPATTRAITDPYYEVGFGIENIFKFAKIDFVWRLTPGTGTYYYFLVKPSFKFSF